MLYNRSLALAYAHRWAYARNPAYYSFDGVGGDCTSFVSQCLYAGGCPMNYTRDVGWYYLSPQNRSAAWSGVVYLYNFLTRNRGTGPYGEEQPLAAAQLGDIVQLAFDGERFSHSLLVTGLGGPPGPDTILLTTHSMDVENRPLATYPYQACRLIHLQGVRD